MSDAMNRPWVYCPECGLYQKDADAKIAEQAQEIERLKANVANWERKEIGRAIDCHGQEQRAKRAEREIERLRSQIAASYDGDLLEITDEKFEELLESMREARRIANE